jgi:hypothetical protein
MKFRFTIIDNDNATTTVVSEPVGWDSLVLKLDRDKQYHGFFEYTDDELAGLKFYGAGREIIKNAFDTIGIDANIECVIDLLCDPDGTYTELYRGRIDFDRAKFECGLRGCFAEVALTKSSCILTLNNRANQSVDLNTLTSFDGDSLSPYDFLGFTMVLPPKPLKFIYWGTRSPGDDIHVWNDANLNGGGGPVYGQFYEHIWQVGFDIITSDTLQNYYNQYYDLHQESDFTPFAAISPGILSLDVQGSLFCLNDTDIEIVFNGSLFDNTTNTRIFDCAFIVDKVDLAGNVTNISTTPVFVSLSLGVPTLVPIAINFTGTVDLQQGERIYAYLKLLYQYTTSGSGGVVGPTTLTLTVEDTSFNKLMVVSECQETTVKAHMINESLSRTAEILTNDCLRVYSEYFGRTDAEPYANGIDVGDGCGGLEAITNGLFIRNVKLKDGANPKMFVTWQDMLASLNAIHNIGMGLVADPFRSGFKMLRIERFDYFYQNTTILQCPNVPVLNSAVDPDKYVTKLTVGYEKWQAEEYGGQDDFHGQREYRTRIKTIPIDKGTLSRLSKYIASGYSIEVTRRESGGNDKDWRFDNDVFIIEVKRDDATFAVEIPNIDTSANIFDPDTTYNIGISPARNAMRWVKYIAQSLLPNYTGTVLIFSAGQGNFVAAALEDTSLCRIENAELSESEDIATTKFSLSADYEPVMFNILDSFEYPLTVEDFNTVQGNPYGVIEYSCNNGTTYKGYLQSLSFKPESGKAEFILIRANL